MANFIKYDYKQDVMLVINFEEQLQPGTFEYASHYLIDNKLDLSIFHPKFKNKHTGHRMSVVEPAFGNIGTNKGLNRFSLRGSKKVNGQWKLFCLIQNIEKLKNYGELAAWRIRGCRFQRINLK